jgi:cytochrome c
LLATALLCCAVAVGVQAQTPAPSGETAGSGDPKAAKADQRAAEKQRRGRPGNLIGHGGPIKAIAVDDASGRVLTGSFDYAMMHWDIASETPQRLYRFDDHNGAVNAVAFVPGGKLALAGGDDGAVALWDLSSHKLVHRFPEHQAKIVGLAVTADGRWAASAGWDHTVRIWDLAKLEAGPVLKDHTGPVNAVVFSGDGTRVYTAGADGSIGLWNRQDGSFERTLHRHGWGINVLARLPGTEQVVFGALNGTAAIVDGVKGDVIRDLAAYERPVLSVAVLEKPGLIAIGGGDGLIRVLRSGDGSLIQEYRNPYGPVWALAFVADGTALYYGGLDDFATLWRIVPRDPFEAIDSPFPRRFQVHIKADSQLAAGELQFARKCSVCHTVHADGGNRAGPSLHKVFGRRIGTLDGYPYSDALRSLDIVWTADTIGKLFELGPEEFTPGSKMPLQKMTNPAQRDALIAYLKLATEPGQPGLTEAERAAPSRRATPGEKQ